MLTLGEPLCRAKKERREEAKKRINNNQQKSVHIETMHI